MKLSIVGSTGFIGSNFVKKYPNHIKIERNALKPESEDILYLISTVDNYNVFEDITRDMLSNSSNDEIKFDKFLVCLWQKL